MENGSMQEYELLNKLNAWNIAPSTILCDGTDYQKNTTHRKLHGK
jgi:hypothetical protein